MGLIATLATMPQKAARVLAVLSGIYLDGRYDRVHHVKTTGAILLDDLDVEGDSVEFGNLYDAFPARSFHHLLSLLPTSELTFVDYGSGMGRVLFIAAEHDFRKIIGVEFSRELHDIAAANITPFRNPRQECTEIDARHEDAMKFSVPEGNGLLFFFSPFHGEVLEKVLENIKLSYLESPRPLLILFVTDPETHPLPRKELHETGVFRETLTGLFPFDPAKRYPLEYAVFEADATLLQQSAS